MIPHIANVFHTIPHIGCHPLHMIDQRITHVITHDTYVLHIPITQHSDALHINAIPITHKVHLFHITSLYYTWYYTYVNGIPHMGPVLHIW